MLIGIGLLIVGLFAIIGGDSPFVIPHLDKYVKTYVVDDSEKQIVLDLLKDAKSERKEVSKTNADYLKELQKLTVSREATPEKFDDLAKRMGVFNKEAQKENLNVTREVQKHITAEEWKIIQISIAEDLEKSDKDKVKHIKQLEGAFDKWIAKINKTIIDEDKRKAAVESVEELRKINLANYKEIQIEFLNKNSAAFKYKATESELTELQNELIGLIEEVYDANTKTHFDLVKATTEEEWKKIQ